MVREYVNQDLYSIRDKVKNNYNKKGLTPHVIRIFQKIIYEYYHAHGRFFPWRVTHNPYHILVSEIMLQQTSTQRVQEKYEVFIEQYPDFTTLAHASLPSILNHWQGLGYNRRALYLKKIAEMVITRLRGKFPRDEKSLQALPGIGPYTAAAICAFAFNQPTVLLETNIQSVYIYFFFENQKNIKDSDLHPFIKKTHGNPSRKSSHYTKQSPFENSNRQLRGLILRVLLEDTSLTLAQLSKKTNTSPDRLLHVLFQLEKEGFIQRTKKAFTLSS